MVKGYAVVQNGIINIKTVSPSRRAAIVNWLIVEHSIRIFQWTTDKDIETLWEHNRGCATVNTVKITL